MDVERAELQAAAFRTILIRVGVRRFLVRCGSARTRHEAGAVSSHGVGRRSICRRRSLGRVSASDRAGAHQGEERPYGHVSDSSPDYLSHHSTLSGSICRYASSYSGVRPAWFLT